METNNENGLSQPNEDDNNGNNEDDDGDGDDNSDSHLIEVVFRAGDRYNEEEHYDERVRLIIHESVDVIAEDAFYYCRFLVEVVFHNNITRIESGAFYGCRNLRRIVNGLPKNLIHLGREAFFNCFSLEGEIVFPRTLKRIQCDCFYGCTSVQSVVFDPTANVQLGYRIFYGCTELRWVTLPQNLQRIPDCCFCYCTSVEEIRIPKSVHALSYSAFKGSGLRFIDLSENVRIIGRWAFAECHSLERVTIRSSSLYMGDNVFTNCSSLSIIDLYSWLWHKIFESMNDDLPFIFKFFKQYHNHIFDM